MVLTNSILSEKLGVPLFRFRRWTKELLPPDPVVTRRSGVARELTLNEGFKVYLGGMLVGSHPQLTFYIVRLLLKPIWAMLELHNMIPAISENAVRVGIDREVHTWKTLEIAYIPKPDQGIFYTELSLIGSTLKSRKSGRDALGRKFFKANLIYTTMSTDLQVKESGFTINTEKIEYDPNEIIHIDLNIDHHLSIYQLGTDTGPTYYKKLRALLKEDDPKKLKAYKKDAGKIYKL